MEVSIIDFIRLSTSYNPPVLIGIVSKYSTAIKRVAGDDPSHDHVSRRPAREEQVDVYATKRIEFVPDGIGPRLR
jgi:hypothetical protein